MPSVHAVARRRATPQTSRHPATKSGRHVARATPMRVVVVDDHEDIRAIFSEVLGAAGWSVRSYADAPSALAGIAEDPPDLVLTDINLGGLSGRALARTVRADPRTSHIGIVAASGSVAPSSAMMRMFDLFLVKPVELSTLSDLLIAVLENRADQS